MITAIIANYYSERQKYWKEIIPALFGGSMKPERLIVWDNLPSKSWELDQAREGYPVWKIRSNVNTLLGRYAAILLAGTEFVFVQDNDLVVGKETIETLYWTAFEHRDRIVGTDGVILQRDGEPRRYSRGKGVYSPGPCDVIKGRLWAASKDALLPGFQKILSGASPGRSDDILFSLSCRGGYVAPAEFRNLDEEGVGLSHEPQHLAERDQYAEDLSTFWAKEPSNA